MGDPLGSMCRILGLDEQRLINALRLAVGCCLASTYIMWHQGPYSFYVPVTVALVLQPTLGADVRKSALRMIGVVSGGLVALVLTALAAHGDVPLMAGLFVAAVVCGYFATEYFTVGSNASFAPFSCFLLTCIIFYDSVTLSGEADYEALFRSFETGVGILISLLTVSLLWPRRTTGNLDKKIREFNKQSLSALPLVLAEAEGREVTEDGRRALELAGKPNSDLVVLGQLLAQAAAEESRVRRREVEYREWTAEGERLRSVVAALRAAASRLAGYWTDERRAAHAGVRECCERICVGLSEGPHGKIELDGVQQDLNRARELLPRFRDPEEGTARPGDRSDEAAGREYSRLVETAVDVLERQIEVCRRFSQDRPDRSKKRSHSLRRRLDPVRVRCALRSGIVAVVMMYVVAGLDWPMPSLSMWVAAGFSAAVWSRRIAIMVMLLIVSSAWVSAGAVVFLKVFYFPHVDRLPGLLVAVFGCVALFSYLSSGKNPLLHLLGLGPVIVAGLMLSMDVYNNTDLEPTYRIAQAWSLGGVALGLAAILIWPTTELERVRGLTSELLDLCRQSLSRQHPSDGPELVEELTELTSLCIGNQLKAVALMPAVRRRSSEAAFEVSELIARERALVAKLGAHIVTRTTEGVAADAPAEEQGLERAFRHLDAALRVTDRTESLASAQRARKALRAVDSDGSRSLREAILALADAVDQTTKIRWRSEAKGTGPAVTMAAPQSG